MLRKTLLRHNKAFELHTLRRIACGMAEIQCANQTSNLAGEDSAGAIQAVAQDYSKSMNTLRPATLFLLFAFTGISPADALDKKKKPPVVKPTPAPKTGGANIGELPIPKGSPQKEIRFPVFTVDGKKKMYYRIGVATWTDDENIEMRDMELQTYAVDGKEESVVKLPDAVLNVPTNVITAKAKVTISDDRFEITAKSLSYDMDAKDAAGNLDRVAILGGGVKMVIFDTDSLKSGEKKSGDAPKIEIEPLKDQPTKK